MKNLNYFYENSPEAVRFIPRKKELVYERTIICGAINSGKSYLAKNEISSLKQGEFLYINFADLRFNVDENFIKDLDDFLFTHSEISSLFFDNYSGEIHDIENFAINCRVNKFIITTRDKNLAINGFEKLHLTPLCFEEFIAFNRRYNEINTIISVFFSQGNGVKNASLTQNEILEFEQNLLLLNFNNTEILILTNSLEFLHTTFSANKIYTTLKEKIKISKDLIYATIAKFEYENLIYLIPKFDEEKRAKKLYFSNFNLKEILTTSKDFNKKFVNIVFCELLHLDRKIYYTSELDFYIPSLKLGILVIPFSSSDIIFLRFRKIFSHLKKLNIIKLKVVSIANSGSLEIEGIDCDVVPFGEFALSF